MVSQPRGCHRRPLGDARPARAYEDTSAGQFIGHTLRCLVAGETTGWLAVSPAGQSHQFRRHCDAMDWLAGL